MIGDKFVGKTFGLYFQQNENSTAFYMKQNFDVLPFFTMGKSAADPEIISRIRNCLIEALNKKPLLPKYIMVVLEHDILDGLLDRNDRISDAKIIITRAIEAMMSGMQRLILERKEFLPKKLIKIGYPQTIWIEPPQHKNFSDNLL